MVQPIVICETCNVPAVKFSEDSAMVWCCPHCDSAVYVILDQDQDNSPRGIVKGR